jgi:hypothetical protein
MSHPPSKAPAVPHILHKSAVSNPLQTEVHISTASSTTTLNSSVERQKPIPESPVIFILFFFTVAKRK